MSDKPWPDQKEIDSLPIPQDFEAVFAFYAKLKMQQKDPRYTGWARVLVTEKVFLKIVETMLELKMSPRELKTYSSKRLQLIPPPVRRDGDKTDYYIYPDHFDALAPTLTLRKGYHLSLKNLRSIMGAMPKEGHHMIVNGMLTSEDLLDLAKVAPLGFALKDLVMAKTCETMLHDILPIDEAVMEASKPGDELCAVEEVLILRRLEEIKKWVTSGRRREFIYRESEEDARLLAERRIINTPTDRAIMFRRQRGKARKG